MRGGREGGREGATKAGVSTTRVASCGGPPFHCPDFHRASCKQCGFTAPRDAKSARDILAKHILPSTASSAA